MSGYEVLSTGPTMLLQFTANSATPGQGFAATFHFQPPPDSTAADSDRLLKLSFGKVFESLGPEVSATRSDTALNRETRTPRDLRRQLQSRCLRPPLQLKLVVKIIQPELDTEILALLGDAPKSDIQFGKPTHKDLASRWQDILEKGLLKDVKEKILDSYLIPEIVAC
ncbi:hypothetical protein MSG28_007991 [Choristoneura fumiferana]|uniref:Uncharacterized protein n=1 Tax=Choristoneura fumiferana TaxID=7141 RepID=A0ACC0J9I7_CHOFU|nr:hypothetical protein MSG28_007991 [Choristoneura fumiferana]